MTGGQPFSRRTALTGVVGATLVSTVGCTPVPGSKPVFPSEVSTAGTTAPAAPETTGPRGAEPTGSASLETPSPPPRTPAPATVLRTAGPDLRRGRRDARVALTFHGAGPAALAEEVLALLDRASAPVTVFAVGRWLQDHHVLGHAIASAGHDLGNHTWSHQAMLRLDPAQALEEVQRGAHAVAAVLGHPGLLFRPSGTPASNPTIRAAARAAGYRRCISYDVDPADYLDPGATAVRDRTLAQVRPGSIVSLHLGHPGTVAALPGILRGLARRGLEPVTVTDMFAR